jgi:hypothetical protein
MKSQRNIAQTIQRSKREEKHQIHKRNDKAVEKHEETERLHRKKVRSSPQVQPQLPRGRRIRHHNHQVIQAALVKQTGNSSTQFSQTLNPVHGFGVTVTPPVWQASIGEEIHFLTPYFSEV